MLPKILSTSEGLELNYSISAFLALFFSNLAKVHAEFSIVIRCPVATHQIKLGQKCIGTSLVRIILKDNRN